MEVLIVLKTANFFHAITESGKQERIVTMEEKMMMVVRISVLSNLNFHVMVSSMLAFLLSAHLYTLAEMQFMNLLTILYKLVTTGMVKDAAKIVKSIMDGHVNHSLVSLQSVPKSIILFVEMVSLIMEKLVMMETQTMAMDAATLVKFKIIILIFIKIKTTSHEQF